MILISKSFSIQVKLLEKLGKLLLIFSDFLTFLIIFKTIKTRMCQKFLYLINYK